MINMERNMRPVDVSQWLREGWFYFKASPKHRMRVAQLMHTPEGPTDSYIARCVDGEDFKFKKPENHCFPHWPTLGAFNIEWAKIAVYLKRQQQKQWKRTFNYRQLSMIIPRKWEITQQSRNAGQLLVHNPNVVKAAFDPMYPSTIARAKGMFTNGWGSVALDPRIIVTNTKPRLVYYRGKLACKVDGHGFETIDPRLTSRVAKAYPGGIVV